MSKIFTYQTYLRIILTANIDITGAITTEIHYKKPISGTTGTLPATVQTPATGVIYYDLEPDSEGNDDFLDEAGKWKFWTYVEFADGRTARGETVTTTIWKNDE